MGALAAGRDGGGVWLVACWVVGSWPVSARMAATAWGVLVVMVAKIVTWCMSVL